MKTITPQHDLPGAETVFNLADQVQIQAPAPVCNSTDTGELWPALPEIKPVSVALAPWPPELHRRRPSGQQNETDDTCAG